MKKFLLVALMLTAFSALAEEVLILDAELRSMSSNASVNTSFQMDKVTDTGSVKVVVSEIVYDYNPFPYPGPMNCDRYGRCYPGHHQPIPRTVTLMNEMVRVQGLTLVGKKVMFEGQDGPVHCGTMGYTRIFKRPAIFLSGNCDLTGRINRRGNVVVKMLTR